MTIKAQHDTFLRCTVCGRESATHFASSLQHGWERCCGITMRLESTSADIAAATRQAAAALRSTEAGAPHAGGSDHHIQLVPGQSLHWDGMTPTMAVELAEALIDNPDAPDVDSCEPAGYRVEITLWRQEEGPWVIDVCGPEDRLRRFVLPSSLDLPAVLAEARRVT